MTSGCYSLVPVLCCKRNVSISAGGDVSAGKNSPRPNRSSRPLSSVFQNIHPPNIWRHRKGTVSFNQVHLQRVGFSLCREVHHTVLTWMTAMPCLLSNIANYQSFPAPTFGRRPCPRRAPLVAVCSAARRARGAGRDCGSS